MTLYFHIVLVIISHSYILLMFSDSFCIIGLNHPTQDMFHMAHHNRYAMEQWGNKLFTSSHGSLYALSTKLCRGCFFLLSSLLRIAPQAINHEKEQTFQGALEIHKDE